MIEQDVKPDVWIAFDWPKFQSATIGMRREHKWSYWNACCAYYWSDCDGLPNDDDMLRAVCECYNPGDWAITKSVIFNGKLFKLEDGRWHQKRAREEYQKAQHTITANKSRAINAAAARWNKPKSSSSNAQASTQAMHEDMLKQCPTPTPVPTPIPVPVPEVCTINKKGVGVALPSLEDAKTQARFIGMTVEDAEAFWNHFEASGWIDKNGNQIVNWRAKMRTWKTNSQASKSEAAHKGSTSQGLSGAQQIVHSKELDRVNEQLKRLDDGAAQDAMGVRYLNEADKRKRATLIARRTQLRKMLDIVV